MSTSQNLDQGGIVPSVPHFSNNNASAKTDLPPITVTLLRIDEIVFTYLQDIIKPTVVDNGKVINVPVIYGNPERWKAIRKDGYVRDKFNKLQVPVIVLMRTAIRKNTLTSPVNKYLNKTYETKWNRHNSYDKFNVLNHIIPSKEFFLATIPDYVDLQYDVILWTEYREQMNSLIEQINFEADEYWGKRNDFKFRVSIDGFSDQSDLPTSEDRVIRTGFSVTVKAYLLPESARAGDAAKTQNLRKVYGAKKIVRFEEIDGIKILNDK